MEMDKNKNNKTKWIIGLVVLVVLAVGAFAVFSGPIGDQLTGAFSFRNRESAVARLRTQPVASEAARQLSICNKNLGDCNTCLDVVKHYAAHDFTPWANSNNISDTTILNCANRIGGKTVLESVQTVPDANSYYNSACLDIIQHISTTAYDDLSAWMMNSGVSSEALMKCVDKIGQQAFQNIRNLSL